MERVDLSSPEEQPSIHRCEIAPPPTLLDRARILVSRDRTGRNIGYPRKQSSPYIRKMQHTVLSVDGLKGTMSEAELHLIRARMRGGLLNKANRGELTVGLPCGFVYDDQRRVVLDPDQQVQRAIRCVFETFRLTGAAFAVAKTFHQQGFKFPHLLRERGRPSEILWGDATHRSVVNILRNPRYAGAYFYGRTRCRSKPGGGHCI